MSIHKWVCGIPTNTYLHFLWLYENNTDRFHNELKNSTGTVAQRIFWKTLFERRSSAHEILSSHAVVLLQDEGMHHRLVIFFKEALLKSPSGSKEELAEQLYKKLDPRQYLQLLKIFLREPKEAELTIYLVNHILTLKSEKFFPLLLRPLLSCLLNAQPQVAKRSMLLLNAELSHSPHQNYYEQEWPELNLTQQCRLIPFIPIDFTFCELQKAGSESFFSLLSTFLSTFSSLPLQSTYFRRALADRRPLIPIEELVRLAASRPESPLHLHIICSLKESDFEEFVKIEGHLFTEFLYSTRIFSSEETLHLLLELRDSNVRRNFLLDQAEVHIYDDEGRVGIETPASFCVSMQNAFKNQTIDGELLSNYSERLKNLPAILWVIYASHEEFFNWIVDCTPYLLSKPLHYLSWVFTPEQNEVVMTHLLDCKSYLKAINYLQKAPTHTQIRLLAYLLSRYYELHIKRLQLETEFNEIPFEQKNFDALNKKMQEVLAVRSALNGPLTHALFKNSWREHKRLPEPVEIAQIRHFVNESKKTDCLWVGKEGIPAKVWAMAPDDEAPSTSELPAYLLEQLNTHIFDISNLESAQKLEQLGLVSEKDFEVLGLTKEMQLEVDKIEIELNQLIQTPPPEVAITWEEIKRGAIGENYNFPELLTLLKQQLSFPEGTFLCDSEEAQIKFKLSCILLRALALPTLLECTRVQLKSVQIPQASHSEIFNHLIRCVRDQSFENKLIRYLTQENLESIWAELKEGGTHSLHQLISEKNLSCEELFQLSQHHGQ